MAVSRWPSQYGHHKMFVTTLPSQNGTYIVEVGPGGGGGRSQQGRAVGRNQALRATDRQQLGQQGSG